MPRDLRSALLTGILPLLLSSTGLCQLPESVIRGTVIDRESKTTLVGATVRLLGSERTIAEVTDIDGSFALLKVPVGRWAIELSYIGYQPALLSNLSVTSGKELVLTVELEESIHELQEVVISGIGDKRAVLNEMATVSARSFSVEESERYAASFLDPARMAQNYAGVSSSGDDLSNEIVIRGNSPAYVQWRLEGIEIPSPNHFADKGSSGGGISMLSSSMLANSDFYSGAFPAEIGNALAGAFDLRFRKGNNQKREHSLMVGVVGLEASTEGPLSKNSKASYLFNYRYSALELISRIADLDFGDYKPNFQDLSFNINVPTKKAGTFSLFGLGARAGSSSGFELDPRLWRNSDDTFNDQEDNLYGLLGFTHRYLFKNQKTYLKTVLSTSYEKYQFDEEFYDVLDYRAVLAGAEDPSIVVDEAISLTDRSNRASITLHHKANAQSSLRSGVIISNLGYDFQFMDRLISRVDSFRVSYTDSKILVDDRGSTMMIQAFGQWKYRATDSWTVNVGMHYTRLGLTGGQSLEPRLSVKWQVNPRQALALAGGLHSTSEHLINYTLQKEDASGRFIQPNLGLPLTKAAHFVLGYDQDLGSHMRLKTEVYYQHLYDLPIDPTTEYVSIINTTNVFDVVNTGLGFIGEGTGRNMGIDVTLERFLDRGFYYLVTGSIFDSSFKDLDGRRFNTRFNSRYNLTLLGGREFKVGKSKSNVFGLNSKLVFNGGNRYTRVNFASPSETKDGLYALQINPYFRADISFSYQINSASTTHRISLDIQNFTNTRNVLALFPDYGANIYRKSLQSGLIPNINYRVEF